MNDYDGTEPWEDAGALLFSPDKIIAMAQRHYALIGAVIVSVIALGIGIAYTLPVKYEATTRILIDSRERKIVEMVDVLSGLESNTPTIESEVEIMKSRGIAFDVIKHMEFANDPQYGGAFNLISRGVREVKALLFTLVGWDVEDLRGENPGLRGDLIDAYYAGLGVRRVRNTYLIEISFEASDPRNAADVANTIADFYLRHQLQAKIKAAGLATSWLELRINDLRKKVVAGEGEIEEFKLKHKMVDTEGHLLNEKQMARAMEQTVLAQSNTFDARAKYLQIRRLMENNRSIESIADVLKSPTIRMLKDRLAKVTQKRAELATRYGSRHPEMRKIAAEYIDVGRQLGQEVGRIVANLKNQFDEAEARENSLARSLGGLRAKSALSRKASVSLRELQREVKASRLVYEKFLERYRQTAEQEKMQLPDARIVEAALPPSFPSSPKRVRIIALAAGGGIVLAVLIVFLVEISRPGMGDPDELKSLLRISNVAPIPLIEGAGAHSHAPLGLMRHVVDDARSQFSDSIRELRYMLDAGQHPPGSRVIMVASALPEEGKSVIASNLAHHFASVGVKTVLVDGDLREPSLTRTLTPDGGYGMYECLRDNQLIDAAIVKDRMSGLHFLPAKGQAPLEVSPVDVLGSGRMLGAFDRLRDSFDVVVVDCPPVGLVIDARILAEQSDQLVFVCQWRGTNRTVAAKAYGDLQPDYRKFAVAAFNKMDPGEFNSRYGYGRMVLGRPDPRRMVPAPI